MGGRSGAVVKKEAAEEQILTHFQSISKHKSGSSPEAGTRDSVADRLIINVCVKESGFADFLFLYSCFLPVLASHSMSRISSSLFSSLLFIEKRGNADSSRLIPCSRNCLLWELRLLRASF
jgi:hypothetical protein